MYKKFKIGKYLITKDNPKCFIIAEIGINHMGNFQLCKKMIVSAAKSGADAVKLQTIEADESYMRGTDSYKIFKGKSFSIAKLKILKNIAQKNKIEFFTTPGDLTSLKKVKKIGVPAIKISSGLLSNTPLIAEAAKLNKPIIFSTGMANLKDIKVAINTAKKNGCKKVSILKCTSLYPAKANTLNLNGINTLREIFNIPIGYSDHFLGELACYASINYNASIIEKHFTINKKIKGADNKISSEPNEFKKMVENIRELEKMRGDGKIYPREKEKLERKLRYRYIVTKKNVKKNEKISFETVAFKRLLLINKKNNLPANLFWKINKKIFLKDLNKDTPLVKKYYK